MNQRTFLNPKLLSRVYKIQKPVTEKDRRQTTAQSKMEEKNHEQQTIAKTPASTAQVKHKQITNTNQLRQIQNNKCQKCKRKCRGQYCNKCTVRYYCKFCNKSHKDPRNAGPSPLICKTCYQFRSQLISTKKCEKCQQTKPVLQEFEYETPNFLIDIDNDVQRPLATKLDYPSPGGNTNQSNSSLTNPMYVNINLPQTYDWLPSQTENNVKHLRRPEILHIFRKEFALGFTDICVSCHNYKNSFTCQLCQNLGFLVKPYEHSSCSELISHSFQELTSLSQYCQRNNLCRSHLNASEPICSKCTALISLGGNTSLFNLPFTTQVGLGILHMYPEKIRHTNETCIISYETPCTGEKYILHGKGENQHLYILNWIQRVNKDDCPYCTEPLNTIDTVYIQG